jgi:hypothetical protein
MAGTELFRVATFGQMEVEVEVNKYYVKLEVGGRKLAVSCDACLNRNLTAL